MLAPDCVDKGEYVDHGTFGEIYHGAVYPTAHATDSEGRQVAIKIDKDEGKDLIMDNACKAYLEMRSEVSILQPLKHPHIIEFIGQCIMSCLECMAAQYILKCYHVCYTVKLLPI